MIRMQAESMMAASGAFSDKENNPIKTKSLVPIPAIDMGRSAIKPAAAITQDKNIKLYFIPAALNKT